MAVVGGTSDAPLRVAFSFTISACAAVNAKLLIASAPSVIFRDFIAILPFKVGFELAGTAGKMRRRRKDSQSLQRVQAHSGDGSVIWKRYVLVTEGTLRGVPHCSMESGARLHYQW